MSAMRGPHHIIHAVEEWKRGKEWQEDSQLRGLAALALKAEVFLLPDGGNLLGESDPNKLLNDLAHETRAPIRLPFWLTAVEFTVARDPKIEINGTKRFALCIDLHAAPMPLHHSFDGEERPDFVMWTGFWDETVRRWTASPYAMAVSPRDPLTKGTSGIRGHAIPLTDEVAALPADLLRAATEECGVEISAVASLIVALSCRNVHSRSIDPSARLNAARARRGKTPFSRYHVLELTEFDDHKPHELGGTHRSPALHVRRGHVRMTRWGRSWVNEHMVGRIKNGLVTKDYRLKPRQQVAP